MKEKAYSRTEFPPDIESQLGHNQQETQEQNSRQKHDLQLESLVNAEIIAQTKELSGILRQLAFSAVAICWILMNLRNNAISIEIWGALIATFIFFFFELLQYALTTIGLRSLRGLKSDKKEDRLARISDRSYIFYYFKIAFLLISYSMIVAAFIRQFTP